MNDDLKHYVTQVVIQAIVLHEWWYKPLTWLCYMNGGTVI